MSRRGLELQAVQARTGFTHANDLREPSTVGLDRFGVGRRGGKIAMPILSRSATDRLIRLSKY